MSRDALVVGINSYDRLNPLNAPAADAESIAQLLTNFGDFRVRRLPEAVKDGTVTVGKKTKVSVGELEDALIQLFNPEGKNIPETALLYFSGHGLRKVKGGMQEGFLATSEVNPNLGFYGLSLQWLRRLLQESPVKQQIIWLDCCHSGELLNFEEGDPGDRGKGRDRCFIAASREFEVAYEEISGNHGVLTSTLLQGLDPTQHLEGVITNYTLVDFINSSLKTATQKPIFANSGGKIILTGKQQEITQTVEGGICPYKGLSYFDCNEEDPKYFYGRTALTDELLDKVREGNFIAILGASGSGKSSVVRAGLLHQLKLGQRLSGSDSWKIYIFRPGEHPLKSLAAVFVEPELSTIERASQLQKAEELIGLGAVGLKRLVAAANSRVVLLVDQFEEIFTVCKDNTERQQFLECLLGEDPPLPPLRRGDEQLGDPPLPPLRKGDEQDEISPLPLSKLSIILTMRADFFGKCAEQEYAGLAKKIQENLITVTPMTAEELEQAITEPAKQVGLEVERELVTLMLADVEGSPGSLPLLQYTLTELWQRRTMNRLVLSTYTKLGGLKGTLQKRADEIYESFSDEEKLAAKRIFLELTQLGEGTEDTRRQVRIADLVAPPDPPKSGGEEKRVSGLVPPRIGGLGGRPPRIGGLGGQLSNNLIQQTIQKLADAKLIVTSTLIAKGSNSAQVAVVDVAHESLIRYWPKLRQWLNENRETLRQKRTIEAAAQEWEEKGKGADYLLQGLRLAEAENFLGQSNHTVSLTAVAREFVAKSIQRQRNNRRRTIGIVAGVMALLTGFGGFAAVNWSTAEKGKANAQGIVLNLSSQKLFPLGLEFDALIEAIKAGKLVKKGGEEADTKMQVIPSLAQLVHDVKNYNNLVGDSDWVFSVSFSPDGQTIASGSRDNTIKLWSREGKELATLKGHSREVISVSFSPDGQTIASGSNDNTIKLWSRDGKELATLKGHSSAVSSVSFSPDGKTLASGSYDKTIILWNFDLDNLLGRSCNWLRDYLKNPNNGMTENDERRRVCDGIGTNS
ncbi:caspase family protein [Argonema galeatum]|uniref:nSTAND1 domain-containing NTPase n=1 Tax=Argonema galeatum TaxID=2942762 RepID=UPI0020127521|nr:caspase family protein [Argonema galeatum]MCL1467582.1 caspase family protein [Argonema galeatum A003/A1]